MVRSKNGARAGFSLALVSFVFPGTVIQAATSVVYDNSNPVKDAGGKQVNFRTAHEFGDEISLGGVARYVTLFNVDPALVENSFPDANFVVRFYKNNGADADPGPKVILGPGTLLWESSSQPVTQGAGVVSLAVPFVKVPDSFTWTIQYANVNNSDAGGLVLGDPIGIGKSFNDFWEKTRDGSWSTKVFPTSGFKANFVAQVTAAPDLGPVALVATVKGSGASVNVNVRLVLGQKYQLQSSKDLKVWTVIGAAFVAESENVSQEFAASEPGRYFRVVEIL
ncbi:MAG: hypothetical protein EXS36_14710 [Pedosphaera sp.]|nr:hypothetical protein [Pedosphaera sp.]